jgi:hypothetical protein
MKEVTLQMPSEKYPHFLELAKNLKYVKFVNETKEEEYEAPTKKQVLAGIKQAVKEINLVNKGKIKTRDAMELFNEL